MTSRAPEETFANAVLAADSLPDFRAVVLQPVAPAYRPYAVTAAVLGWLVPLGAVLIAWAAAAAGLVPAALGALAPVGFGALLVIAMINAVFAAVDARRRAWALREHDLIYRSGVLWRRSVIVPFARIQHVETVSGPLERRFGLTRLKCFTAGGSGGDLTVAGLDLETARRVRQFLLERIRDGEDDGAAVSGPHEAPNGADD